jgi:hypothetical protein
MERARSSAHLPRNEGFASCSTSTPHRRLPSRLTFLAGRLTPRRSSPRSP